MRKLVSTLTRWWRRPAPGPVAEVPAPAPQPDDGELADVRRLCQTIDDAVTRGDLHRAEAIAAPTARLAADHPGLSERLARLHLIQGDPDTALRLIEACRSPRASLRLLRLMCLLQIGRRDEAHRELHRWSARRSAPLDVRRMLALLDWEAGDRYAAVNALLRNLTHLEDPESLAMLVLLSVTEGDREKANRWTARLRRANAWSTDDSVAELLVESLDLPPGTPVCEPTETHVDHLAAELCSAEPAIHVLVEAQRVRFEPPVARLLRRGLEQALPMLNDQADACEALALLSRQLGDEEATARWAYYGLQINPMSASLSLLLIGTVTPEIDRRGMAA